MDGDAPNESAEVRKRLKLNNLEKSENHLTPSLSQGEEGSLRRGGKKYFKIRSNFSFRVPLYIFIY